MLERCRPHLTRRSLLCGLMALGPAASLLTVAPRGAAAKQSKEAVRYQGEPNGDQQCANCKHFVQPDDGGSGSCKLVAGDISPNAWCTLREARD